MEFKLGVIIDNIRVAKFALQNGSSVVIGKIPGKNDGVQVRHPNLSRQHVQLMIDESDKLHLIDLDSLNGTFINGKRIIPNIPYQISQTDLITFVKGQNIKLVFNPDDYQGTPEKSGNKIGTNTIDILKLLEQKSVLTIGRSEDCDVTLNHPAISKTHASISKQTNGNIYLKDLGSLNGTYLNGHRIMSEVHLTERDFILIGRFYLTLNGSKKLSEELAIRADHILKEYPNGKGLKQSTFEISSKEMLAVMGPSGCGKSTLLKALCGDSPPDRGNVYLLGFEFNTHYDFLKTQIGYVPQDDIVHRELTVYQSLYYAAKLRMPSARDENVKEKIEEVLEELKIKEKRDSLVGNLSGGQRKRVSIAVEILTDPLVLFLDEPTSPLDPQTVKDFLGILKGLTKKGTTVIMVTHKPGDLEYMDSVIFMGDEGHICYHAGVKECRKYFGKTEVADIYSELEKEKAAPWVEKWKSKMGGEVTSSKSPAVKEIGKTNPFMQYRWLTQRYFNIKLNDRLNSAVMVAQAPIIASLICIIFSTITQAVPFLIAISAIWFGTNNAAREIVGELPIYRRERMFNQGILPYVLSKITVLGAFAALQALIFTSIITFFYSNVSEKEVAWNDPSSMFIWILFVSIAASMMGLLLSALVNSTEKVMSIVPIALIPQIMLAGVVAKVENGFVEFLSYFTLSRWGTEGLIIIQKEVVSETLSTTMVEGTGVLDKTLQPPSLISPKFNIEKKDTIINAIDNLKGQFHTSYSKFGKLQSTLTLDTVAIGILSLVFFCGIVYVLKKKDTIKRS